jgi:Zn-dependent peptidase ImmA (M78 family)
MKDFNIKINKKNWQIRFVNSKGISRDSWGECDYPNKRYPKIVIYKNQTKRNLVNTLIHEILHAVRPELCEEAITETADIVEKALNKAGYDIEI